MLLRSFFGSGLLLLAGPSVLAGPLVCTASVEAPPPGSGSAGGIEGNRFMGFGFPDQTLIWDASALQNTTGALLEEQSPPLPMRTLDISSGFNGSLAATEAIESMPDELKEDHFPGVTPLW